MKRLVVGVVVAVALAAGIDALEALAEELRALERER